MNHERRRTTLARVDPLKSLFRNLFELVHPHARGHVVAFLGEFLGTLIFIFLAFAGVETAGASSNVRQAGDDISTAPPQASPSQWLYVALSAGFTLAVTAWTFFRIGGGLFNPVVSETSLVPSAEVCSDGCRGRSPSAWLSSAQSLGLDAHSSSSHRPWQPSALPTSSTHSSTEE